MAKKKQTKLRWVLPLRHDGEGRYIFDATGSMVAEIRGWGSLIAHPHRLSDRDAIDEQIARADAIVECVNAGGLSWRLELDQIRQILARDMTDAAGPLPEPQQALGPVALCVYGMVQELRERRQAVSHG